MTLADDFQKAVDAVYTDRNTQSCIHTDRSSATNTVRAIVELDLSTYGQTLEVSGKTAVISVRRSEMQPPRTGETYTIGGTVYRVDSVIASDELEHRSLCA